MQRGNILYEVERMKLNLMQQISTVKVAYSGVFMMMMLMLMVVTMMLMMMMMISIEHDGTWEGKLCHSRSTGKLRGSATLEPDCDHHHDIISSVSS